jgi:two-component system cell cycle sensor histidine kinase/response regulator CckA
MVLAIVQQSDGHIQVETQIGDGNVFRVLLPRAGHQRTYAADVEDAEVFNAASGNAVVLVLEDEPTLRSIVARNLPDRGYEVLEANHGEAAVEHARQRPDIRLFLSDVVLPRPSGPSIAAKIREADPALRVVFMSGFTDGERTRHPSRAPMRHS